MQKYFNSEIPLLGIYPTGILAPLCIEVQPEHAWQHRVY